MCNCVLVWRIEREGTTPHFHIISAYLSCGQFTCSLRETKLFETSPSRHTSSFHIISSQPIALTALNVSLMGDHPFSKSTFWVYFRVICQKGDCCFKMGCVPSADCVYSEVGRGWSAEGHEAITCAPSRWAAKYLDDIPSGAFFWNFQCSTHCRNNSW